MKRGIGNTIAKKEVQRLISSHGSIVNFGSTSDTVGKDWITKAETILNRRLSDSYKWFLNTYAGGEIGGEEIYSLYGMPFESVNGGDIVFQYLANRKAGLLDDSKLVVSETDLGEVFFFDYSQFENGECPLYLRLPSGEITHYAADFYEFLCKRITAHLS